jgi:hypothetical protein
MRRWLTLRAISLGVLALALMAGMGALGLWQLGAYDTHQTESAKSRLAQPPIGLDRVLRRDSAFPAGGVGRPVIVRGRYDAGPVLCQGPAGRAFDVRSRHADDDINGIDDPHSPWQQPSPCGAGSGGSGHRTRCPAAVCTGRVST